MKETVSAFRTGDTVVVDFRNSVSLVVVTAMSQGDVDFRVVTATIDTLEREGFHSWLQWLEQGCPGASGDEAIHIHDGSVNHSDTNNTTHTRWLQTLLTLQLTPIPDSERKKAGPAPLPDEIDLRPVWQPPIIVQGRTINSRCNAFRTQWPNDGSELSTRPLILYFPTSDTAVRAFPYWIESPTSSYHLRVIDSSHFSKS
jgi:hypothetical protein